MKHIGHIGESNRGLFRFLGYTVPTRGTAPIPRQLPRQKRG